VEAVSIGLVTGAGHGGLSDNNEDKEVQGRGRSAEGRPGWRGGGEFEHVKIPGSVFKKAWGWWRAHGWEQRCSALTGPSGRRTGQRVHDKGDGLGCARRLAMSGRVSWREDRTGGGRYAWRLDAERVRARSSTKIHPSGRGRERAIGT
jgi:hypothetical protein